VIGKALASLVPRFASLALGRAPAARDWLAFEMRPECPAVGVRRG